MFNSIHRVSSWFGTHGETPVHQEEKEENTKTETNPLTNLLLALNYENMAFRSFREMFEKGSFNYPEKPKERIHKNLSYYTFNYLGYIGLMFSYVCVSNPLFLFATISSAILHYTQGYNTQLIGVTFLIILLIGGTTLLTATLIAIGGVLAHSLLRDHLVIEKKTD